MKFGTTHRMHAARRRVVAATTAALALVVLGAVPSSAATWRSSVALPVAKNATTDVRVGEDGITDVTAVSGPSGGLSLTVVGVGASSGAVPKVAFSRTKVTGDVELVESPKGGALVAWTRDTAVEWDDPTTLYVAARAAGSTTWSAPTKLASVHLGGFDVGVDRSGRYTIAYRTATATKVLTGRPGSWAARTLRAALPEVELAVAPDGTAALLAVDVDTTGAAVLSVASRASATGAWTAPTVVRRDASPAFIYGRQAVVAASGGSVSVAWNSGSGVRVASRATSTGAWATATVPGWSFDLTSRPDGRVELATDAVSVRSRSRTSTTWSSPTTVAKRSGVVGVDEAAGDARAATVAWVQASGVEAGVVYARDRTTSGTWGTIRRVGSTAVEQGDVAHTFVEVARSVAGRGALVYRSTTGKIWLQRFV